MTRVRYLPATRPSQAFRSVTPYSSGGKILGEILTFNKLAELLFPGIFEPC